MRTVRREEGLIASKLLLDLVRTAVALFLLDEHAASVCDELLICSAVFIGHAEGRALTAGKIADYIGMPRPTVIRKLQALEARGVVEQAKSKTYRIAMQNGDVRERVNAAIRACTQHIHRASAELSRLDSAAIERQKTGS
jgi:DNA-binding transcriptional ArsR family regulator